MTNSTLDPVQTAPRQIALRVEEGDMTTAYANAIRTMSTAEEVVLDFGMSLPRTSAQGQPAQVFTVDSRIVVNWANAKRMAISLQQMVQAYEQQNGEVSLQPAAGQPKRS